MFPRAAVVILMCFWCCSNTATSSLSPRYQLTEDLLKKYPKDGVDTIPASEDKLVINLRISVYCIFGLSESELLEVNGWVTVSWIDPKLKWKPEGWSGVKSVNLPAEKVWTPDIGIANSKQLESKDFSKTDKLKVEVKSTGEVIYLGYFISETPCPINTTMFPFDRQKCPLVFGSYHTRMSEFKINVSSVEAPAFSQDTVSQWKLYFYDTSDVITGEGHTEDEKFQMVKVTFYLKRKPMYHIILIVVPYCLICLVAAVMFVIKEPGERYGISLTILLAMSVYVMITADGAPKSMDTLSLMDVFLLVQMTLLVVLTFVVVAGPIIFNKEEDHQDANDSDNEDDAVIPGRRSKYRMIGKTSCRWRRVCDWVCLAFYLLASFINGIVCIVVLKSRVSNE